jgi:hypothetical protein
MQAILRGGFMGRFYGEFYGCSLWEILMGRPGKLGISGPIKKELRIFGSLI